MTVHRSDALPRVHFGATRILANHEGLLNSNFRILQEVREFSCCTHDTQHSLLLKSSITNVLVLSEVARSVNLCQLYAADILNQNLAQEHQWTADRSSVSGRHFTTDVFECVRRSQGFLQQAQRNLPESPAAAYYQSSELKSGSGTLWVANHTGPERTTFHERVSEAVRRSQGFLTVT